MRETQNDIQKMQRDAENRIREMQRKADRAIHGNEMPPVPNFVRTPYNRPTAAQSTSQSNQTRNNNSQTTSQKQKSALETVAQTKTDKASVGSIFSRFKGADILKILNFKNIGIDNDVLIIITLILLLSSDDCDQLLILALLYIML